MIIVTKLNGEEVRINSWQIETMESCPDTRITMMSGRQIYVRETAEEIEAATIAWHRHINGSAD